MWRQTATGDWLVGEDRGGTNVIEGQTGLPVNSTVQKCCMVVCGYMKVKHVYLGCVCFTFVRE